MGTRTMVTLSTERLKILQERVLLFDGLSLAQTMHILQKTDKQTMKDGDVLTTEGENARSMYILISGQAVVSRNHAAGTETLAILEPGSTVGEMAIIDSASRSARVTARGDIIVLELSNETLEQLPIDILRQIYRNFAIILARRLRSANVRMGSIASRPEKFGPNEDKLRGMDVSGWDLHGLRAKRANLAGADFRSADLRDADFRGADLRGARLDGADMTGTDVTTARTNDDTSINPGDEVQQDGEQSWEDLMKSLAQRAKGGSKE